MNHNISSSALSKVPSRPCADQSLAEIKTLHGEIENAARTSLKNAVRIGKLLGGIKSTLPHGQWLPWVENNLPFTPRTAQNYIRIFEHRAEIKYERVSHLTDAYLLLSPPTQPEQPVKPDSIPSDAIILQPADFQRFERLAHDDRLVVEILLGVFAKRGQAVSPDDVVGLIDRLEQLARN
jgi:hypothetical protein